MGWEPIRTYVKPKKLYDFDFQKILVFSPSMGILIVQCRLEDEDEMLYKFRFDRDGLSVEDVTHWMQLPPPP